MPEMLGDPWNCPECGSAVDGASKALTVSVPPRILIVHLKRFHFTQARQFKLHQNVQFPLEGLDLAPFCQPVQGALLYDLFAVVNHHGGFGGGHYTAYALRPRPVEAAEAALGTENSTVGAVGVEEDVVEEETAGVATEDGEPEGSAGGGEYTEVGETTPEVDQKELAERTQAWYHLNDSSCSEMEASAVNTADAYLLFYRRRG